MTKKEISMVKRRVNDLKNGHCVCLILIEAKTRGRITTAQYEATKKLEIRCPLCTSGECERCKPRSGRIDVYQAARDLGLLQVEMFDHNKSLNSDPQGPLPFRAG